MFAAEVKVKSSRARARASTLATSRFCALRPTENSQRAHNFAVVRLLPPSPLRSPLPHEYRSDDGGGSGVSGVSNSSGGDCGGGSGGGGGDGSDGDNRQKSRFEGSRGAQKRAKRRRADLESATARVHTKSDKLACTHARARFGARRRSFSPLTRHFKDPRPRRRRRHSPPARRQPSAARRSLLVAAAAAAAATATVVAAATRRWSRHRRWTADRPPKSAHARASSCVPGSTRSLARTLSIGRSRSFRCFDYSRARARTRSFAALQRLQNLKLAIFTTSAIFFCNRANSNSENIV